MKESRKFPMRIVVQLGIAALSALTLRYGAAAIAEKRTSSRLEIRADQLNAGGSNLRHSSSFQVQDSIGLPQPAGELRSNQWVSRGGLSYLIANPKPGDLNENSEVDFQDIFLFTRSWQTAAGEAGYVFNADLVESINDRRVNEEDLFRLIEIKENH